MSKEVSEAIHEEEISACWPVIQHLRGDVEPEDFLQRVRKQQHEGYHLMYVKENATNQVESIAGWRSLNKLFGGKVLYIEDLSTLPQGRGKGHTEALLG